MEDKLTGLFASSFSEVSAVMPELPEVILTNENRLMDSRGY